MAVRLPTASKRLEELDRDELLSAVRMVLADANALSSRIAAVNEIGIAINQSLNLDEILRVVATKAKWLLDFEHFSVCLPDEKGDWQISTLYGAAAACTSDVLVTTQNVGFALRSGQARLIRESLPSPFLHEYASQIIIPLTIAGTVLGTVNFAIVRPEAYTQEDLRIAYMFALQLAAAIRNANHLQALERARDALHRDAQELEERNAELDAYGHTIAHDLKSPLSSILLKADLLKRRYGILMPEPAIGYVDGIRDHVLRMSTMIDQLLWLARLRDAAFNLEMVDVSAVIQSAIARFHDTLEFQQIVVTVAPDILPALGYAQWIEEIFANLIGNAIKYMGAGNPHPGIHIRAVALPDRVRYEVADSGVGIAPEDQARLFDMFSRLNIVNVEGLGLGLSIVRRMVGKLNGQVGVESTLGEGSTFWFSLQSAPATPIESSDSIPIRPASSQIR